MIPVYTGDVSGVCSALYELGGMVVIHDPSGCNSTYNTHDETRWYDTDSMIYISGLAERDAILGNDDKLLRDVTVAAEELSPAFIALTNSPIPFMNGTDFGALAKIIEKRTGIPTFYVRANGMHDYTVGAGNAFAKLADYMQAEPHTLEPTAQEESEPRALEQTAQKESEPHTPESVAEKSPGAISVNILGLTPLDFDAPRSVEKMQEILQTNGFSVNVCLGMGGKNANWKTAPNADVNLVVSSTGFALAKEMERKYGIPYVVGMPSGAFMEPLFNELKKAAQAKKSEVAYAGIESEKNTEVMKLVLIGEAVTMGSLAAAIRILYGIPTQVICPLETWDGLLRDGDCHTEGEEDLEQVLQELSSEYGALIVAADPLYQPIVPEYVRFVPISHEAFSGRCFKRDRKCLVGEW
jgi:nitrogenase molybdenum-iron protein alpha/beta subunit